MYIERLTATFGMLDNDTIAFHEGLNIISAPNESGKSTWCSFIRAMLYGIDSSERSKGAVLPDKQRYAPWSGKPMSGAMYLKNDGKDITILRRSTHPSSPMRDFSAVYTGTSVKVKELEADNVGAVLTGVTEEVFVRSSYIGKNGPFITSSGQLEKKLQSLAAGGEDMLSFAEADARLAAWQRKRLFNRKGMLPETEYEIKELSKRVEEAAAANNLLKQKEKQRDCLTEDLNRHKNAASAKNRREKEQIFELLSAHESAEKTAREAKKHLLQGVFGETDPSIAEDAAEQEILWYRNAEKMQKKRNSPASVIICLMTAVFSLIAFWFGTDFKGLLAGGILFAAASVISGVRYLHDRKELARTEEKMSSILVKYGIYDIEELPALLDEHHARYMEYVKAQRKERRLAEELKAFYKAKADNNAELVVDNGYIDPKEAELEQIKLEIAEIKGSNGDVDVEFLQKELNRLYEKRSVLQREYNAIELARKTLKSADEEIQRQVSPELGKLASEYFEFLTDGKYENVYLDKQLSANVKAADQPDMRYFDYLSTGTKELMYFSVRLSLCQFLIPKDKNCPLIIDDSFAHLDSARYDKVIDLLEKIAESRQVIYFTCREKSA